MSAKKSERPVDIEENYRALFERSFDAIYIHDTDGNFLDANSTALRLLGYTRDEIPSINFATLLSEDQIPKAVQALKEILETGSQKYSNEFQLRRKDGSFAWIETKAFLISRKGKPHVIQGIARDISARKEEEKKLLKYQEELEKTVRERTIELTRANENLREVIEKQKETEKALQESEKKYRELVENINEVIYTLDTQGTVTYVSPVIESLSGYTVSELIGKNFIEFVHEDDHIPIIDDFRKSLMNDHQFRSDYQFITKSGDIRWLRSSEKTIYDGNTPVGVRGILTDVTGQRKTEKQILQSLQEKEILLKEIHHRVKNNMQIISSLLNLQAQQTDDPQYLELLRNSRIRIQSMALVHEMLYKSEDLGQIDFNQYINELVEHLLNSYHMKGGGIQTTIDVQNVLLAIDTAIPCALILNEIISNALKHAFTEKERGEITVVFHRNDEERYRLSISDNGVGIPDDIDPLNTESLGLNLIRTLTDQLKGTVELKRHKGTTYTIEFPVPKL